MTPESETERKEALDRKRHAIDLAVDSIKQQITIGSLLTAGLLALKQADIGTITKVGKLGVLSLGLSVVLGLIGLQVIAYYAHLKDNPLGRPEVRIAGVLQNLTFFAGLLLLLIYVSGI